MNKVLVLGASGLLGRALVKHLVFEGYEVGALSRSCMNNNNNAFKAYAVDVLNYENLELVMSKYNIVINCIGQITNPISHCLDLNTIGTQNIIEAVKNTGSYLIHISTVSVYGSLKIAKEDSIVNPESVYGTIKYFTEYQIKNSLMDYSILRVCNLYGGGQKKGILAYIMRTYNENEINLFFNNDGSLKRYYIHIDDLSSIIISSLREKNNGIFNIIGNDFINIKNLVYLFEKIRGYRFNVVYEDKIPIENIEVIDKEKFKNVIDKNIKNSLESYLYKNI